MGVVNVMYDIVLRLPTKPRLPFTPLQPPSFPMEGGSKRKKKKISKKSQPPLFISLPVTLPAPFHLPSTRSSPPIPASPNILLLSIQGYDLPLFPPTASKAQQFHVVQPNIDISNTQKYYTLVTNVSSASLITITIRAPVSHPTRTQNTKELHLYTSRPLLQSTLWGQTLSVDVVLSLAGRENNILFFYFF